ncbi:carboxypeptidase S [Thelephora terrestris]|uniref:Carboxypeptidase S n=1 Tax=Thelephora terrestris TaxID=56493 RepID=A0A9P6L7S7_9AGAM|nr:carboxypeptidase S [Thelephora terrestris]
MSEKQKGLLSMFDPVKLDRPPSRKRVKTLVIGLCLGAVGAAGFALRSIIPTFAVQESSVHVANELCPQARSMTPVKHSAIWNTLVERSASEEFKERAVEWLSGAVKIRTESYDYMEPVGVDPRWDVFGSFHDYLFQAFPLVHSTLALTKVNTWGLVYVWPGSDGSLKPILLTAHQDVVPVNPETTDEWEYAPYSGHYDGEFIWGRGSSDDKGGLIGILAAIENLISVGFEPSRKAVLAFGFDEEASGLHGAREIAKHLLSAFGEEAFAFIVDEGGNFQESFGSVVAFPAVAEKGYMDVRLSVASPGGHSSIPPKHTSIGLLAALIAEIEANPVAPKLSRDNVFYDTLLCAAVRSAEIDPDMKKAILASIISDDALRAVESIIFKVPLISSLVGTTRAVDIIGGGVKANALPEYAWAVINHRIATDSSVSEVINIDTQLVKPIAAKFNLSLTSFGDVITDPSVPYYGSIVLSDPWGNQLEPAPISPYKGSAAFNILSGTIKSVYNTHRGLNGDDNIEVYPSYMTGNTDTRYYWKLSENIYRYGHGNGLGGRGIGNIHTVNENIPVDSLLEMIEFFTALILNADEATDL